MVPQMCAQAKGPATTHATRAAIGIVVEWGIKRVQRYRAGRLHDVLLIPT